MNLQEILNKYPRPDKSNRTAELAALILARSVKVEAVSPDLSVTELDGLVHPIPDMIPPHIATYAATLLVNRAEQLHKLAEHDCNVGLDERQEKRRDKLQAEVVEIAAAFGFDAETGGDPRGCVVKLHDPKNPRDGDGWGGGWGVYR